MNILAPRLEFLAIPDAVIGKTTLPHRELLTDSMRKASFDESHDPLDRGRFEESARDECDPA
jgi:hypothetical protein